MRTAPWRSARGAERARHQPLASILHLAGMDPGEVLPAAECEVAGSAIRLHLPALDTELVRDLQDLEQLRKEVALLQLLEQELPRLRRQRSQVVEQSDLLAVDVQQHDEM